jgi:hypothetical protein
MSVAFFGSADRLPLFFDFLNGLLLTAHFNG